MRNRHLQEPGGHPFASSNWIRFNGCLLSQSELAPRVTTPIVDPAGCGRVGGRGRSGQLPLAPLWDAPDLLWSDS